MCNCKICNVIIVDELLKKVYYDPDYPQIDIGPFCSSCMTKIRVCSGCHHPKVVDKEITYFDNGDWYCTECAKGLEPCSMCSKKSKIYYKSKDGQYCEECFKKNFKKCSYCDMVDIKNLFVDAELPKAEYPEIFKDAKSICNACFSIEKVKYAPMPAKECQNCGKIYTGREGDKGFCQSCWDRLPTCTLCKEKAIRVKEINTDFGCGVKACQSCQRTLSPCSICGRHTKTPKKIKGNFSVGSLCKYCQESKADIKECSSCLRMTNEFEYAKDTHCESCKHDYTNNKCGNCGRIQDNEGRCRVCQKKGIYNYSLRPVPFFRYSEKEAKDSKTIFMGFENEVTFTSSQNRDSALRKLYKYYDPSELLAKSDGSISGPGYEIVTQPSSIESIREFDMSNMFSSEMVDSSSCGFHVHVGRNAFSSDLHLFKVCQFVHNNEKFIDAISGRKSNNYCEKFSNKPSREIKRSKSGDTGRYVRVNLSNRNTVEFRMFKGCVREFQVRYRLEFVHALVTWARDSSIKDHSKENFLKFVKDSMKSYPNLITFCSSLV